jgi:uncharacterized protein (TIGR00266 family)
MLQVDLMPGDAIVAESDAMVMSDAGVSIEGKLQGGLMSSLARRLFSEETLFQQHIKADKGRPGQVFLAPALPGDIEIIEVGERQFFLNSGCFVASDAEVGATQRLNTSVLGSFFGDTGGFVVMRTEGRGKLCLSAFGQIVQVEVKPGDDVLVDNGHVVAWETSLDYKISTASSKRGLLGRMVSTAMSGEFLVTRFSGNGHLYVSSRNLTAFQSYLKAVAGGLPGN